MTDQELLEQVEHFEADLRRFKSELKRHIAIAHTSPYPTPAERWFTPTGETCIQYGPDDGMEREE